MEFLNKVNLFNIQQGGLDSDSNFQLSSYSSSKFASSSSTSYNVTSFSFTTAGSTLTASGVSDTSFTYGATLTQTDWSIPSTPYSSHAAYSSDLSIDIYVQSSKSTTYIYSEPWIISPYVDTLTMSLSSSYSWISYNSTSKVITINAPSISGVTSSIYYSYIVGTTSNSDHLASIINIMVYTWSVSNCDTCSYSARTTCTSCSLGYTLSNGSCSKSSEYSTLSTVTKYILLSVIVLNFIGSMISLSSLHSIWSMINQYQLYLILPLIGWYMDQNVISYINDFQFLTFNLSFIPLSSLDFLSNLYNFFNIPQADANLLSLGLNSGSTLINYLSMLVLILFIVSVHLLFLLINKLVTPRLKSERTKGIMNKIYYFLTFNIYIRVVWEVYMFMGLSSTFELKKFELDSTGSIVSLIFCIYCCDFKHCILYFCYYTFLENKKHSKRKYEQVMQRTLWWNKR